MTREQIDREYKLLRLARKSERYSTRDGIVHKGGTPSADVERSAVSFALQREAANRGVPFQAGEVEKLVPKYTGALRSLVNSSAAREHPQLGRDIQRYVQPAARLTSPDESTDEEGRTALSNVVTQPGTAHLAGLLTAKGESGKSLLEHADALLERANKDHVPLSRYFATAPTPPKMDVVHGKGGFVDLANPPADIPASALPLEPPASVVKQNVDAALPGVIPAAGDAQPKLPLADLRRKLPMDSEIKPVPNDDGQPLPLADVPEAKTKRSAGHHALIASLVFKKTPVPRIVSALVAQNGVTPATARRQIKAWIDNQRNGLSVEQRPDSPERLAAKKQKPLQVKELYNNVHPQLAGTRLAMHLAQIIRDTTPPVAGNVAKPGDQGTEGGLYSVADQRFDESGRATLHQLAKAALRGEKVPGMNGDLFSAIGRRLTSVGHPLANTYNWHTMDRSLKENRFLENFVRKHIAGAKEILDGGDHAAIRDFWGKVIHHYGRDKDQLARGYSDPDSHAKFWARLRNEYQDFPALNNTNKFNDATVKRLTAAMYRAHTMADERDTTSTIDSAKERAGTKTDWRTAFEKYKANPNTKHMKFSRMPENLADAGDVATAGVLLRLSASSHKQNWISDKIAKIMKEGVRGKKVSQKQAVAIAHSMYEQQHKGD